MSDNTRDTQFQGFAKALIHDLNDVSTTTYASYDEAKKAYELTIARRAYDLVAHACENISDNQIKSGVFFHPNAMVRDIPDMSELPKESS